MAVAVKPSKSLLNIRSGIKSIKASFSGLRKNAGNLNDVMLKKTKVKRESIARNYILSQRRKENERRKDKEDLLEASSIGGVFKRQAKAVASSTKGFLGRIMDFLATLLVGWLLTNLPSIITMAQELIARIQRLYTIVTGFLSNTVNLFRGFGNLLGAVSKNILTFDFMDSKGRVEGALKDLGGTFEDMQSQFDEGFKLLTTSLGEGVVSGEDAAPFGTQYENESMQQQPSSGGGNADFWTLVAVAAREDGDPQGRADVAQSIYNRLASGAYSGKTIRELIIAEGQYQPTWDYPRKRGDRKPNPEWINITDAESAAKAADMSVSAIKSVAANLTNPTLQKNAVEFVQGRTDFTNYSSNRRKGEILRKSGDNYFGWDWNYKGNTIASVPNFGLTPGSPAQTTSAPTPAPIQPGKRFKVNDMPTIGRGVNNIVITDLYGSRGGTHKGLDIAAPLGTYIALRYDCEVVATGTYGRYGLLIDVWVPQLKVQLRMSHLSAVLIKSGRIKAGTSFARVGQSGRATGPHIHFEYDTVKGRSNYGGSGDPSAYVSVLLLTNSPNQGSFSPAPAQIAAPTPAQITPSGTQQRRQASQQLAQQQAGPSIIIIEEEPPAPQPQVSGGGGAMMIPIVINPLNSFITKKLLLDLAYT